MQIYCVWEQAFNRNDLTSNYIYHFLNFNGKAELIIFHPNSWQTNENYFREKKTCLLLQLRFKTFVFWKSISIMHSHRYYANILFFQNTLRYTCSNKLYNIWEGKQKLCYKDGSNILCKLIYFYYGWPWPYSSICTSHIYIIRCSKMLFKRLRNIHFFVQNSIF